MNDNAINITGVTHSFGTGESAVRALNGIDLSIQRGEILALLGPNGAGKTTLLDTVLGLLDPQEGRIEVTGLTPIKAVRAGHISALLQTGGLLTDLTVKETVSVIAGFHGATDRIDQVMERTGLTRLARRRVGKCSGGEQQRLKFALALLPNPNILILDEPTAGMDVTARRAFWNVMREDAAAGTTVIFATHYLEEAEQFARRTVVMHHGSIVADAETSQLRASLGGRIITATLANSADAQLLAELERHGSIVEFDAGRITIRSTESDHIASQLLEHGAHDLEIVAPTLETAFTSLTEETHA